MNEYDAAGRLLSLTDPVGNATTWFYDALGRVIEEKNQLGHSRHFEYDAASRLDKRTDRLGRVIEFDYNDLDQVTEERWYEGETLVRTLTHNYDAAGQLRGASDAAATYVYAPDGLGRLEEETQTIAGFSPSFDIKYVSGYNLAGSRESLKASLGNTPNFTPDFQNDYGYDYLQRLTSLTQQSQTLSGANAVAEKHIKFEYFASGQFKTIGRYANTAGTALVANTFYKYDLLGRLESMIHSEDPEPPTAGGWGTDPLAGYIYIYDAASRIERVNSVHVVNANDINETSIYTYDNTNQLIYADHDAQDDESYAYDANGNRIGGGYVTGLNNQLASDGTYNYVYDAEGNRIRRNNLANGTFTQYAYDHRNRLASVSKVDASQATGGGWGSSSVAAQGMEGGSWGWGPSSGSGSGSDIYSGYDESFEVSVDSVTEGEALAVHVSVITDDPNPDDPWVIIEVYTEDVSAVGGLDYNNNLPGPNWNVIYIDSQGGPWTYEMLTLDDAIAETTQSLAFHIRLDGHPETEIVLEIDIYDNDLASAVTFTADAAPAIEGGEVLLTVAANAELDFEYYVQDVTAVHGTDYSGATSWTPVGADGQVSFPTTANPTYSGTRSFRIYVRPIGYPDSVVELEADIFDRDEVTVETVDYAYDVNNLLVRRTLDDDGPTGENEPTDTFFSWENGQIVFQFDTATSADPSHRYLYNPLATDQIFADENALNEVLWVLTDHLGTTRDLAVYDFTNQATSIASHRVFDTFGILISPPDANFQIIFGFTGVYFDIAIGHSYHRNRWYDPAVGRWINEDPIGFFGDPSNLSRYVGNNPLSFVDPSGLDGDEPWTSLGGWNPFSWPAIRHIVGFPTGYDNAWWKSLELDNLRKARERQRAMQNGDIAGYTDNMRMSPTQAQFCKSAAETNIEVMAAGGPFGIAKSGVDDLLSGGPEHHLATNKNWVSEARGGPWSPKFEKLFKKAGITLDDAANLVRVPGHHGPHPEAYHQKVFDRLRHAVDGMSGPVYEAALLRELDRIRKDACKRGSELNKLLTGK